MRYCRLPSIHFELHVMLLKLLLFNILQVKLISITWQCSYFETFINQQPYKTEITWTVNILECLTPDSEGYIDDLAKSILIQKWILTKRIRGIKISSLFTLIMIIDFFFHLQRFSQLQSLWDSLCFYIRLAEWILGFKSRQWWL